LLLLQLISPVRHNAGQWTEQGNNGVSMQKQCAGPIIVKKATSFD